MAQLGKAPSWDSFETVIGLECAPDGLCIDAEGCVWVADAWMARALRVAPDGKVVEEIKAPEGMHLYSCTLGGENGTTLMICCAPSFADFERKPVTESSCGPSRFRSRVGTRARSRRLWTKQPLARAFHADWVTRQLGNAKVPVLLGKSGLRRSDHQEDGHFRGEG